MYKLSYYIMLIGYNILGPLNPINSPHIAVTKHRTTLLALSIFNFLLGNGGIRLGINYSVSNETKRDE